MSTSQTFLNQILLWIHPKNQERNLISAAFHMLTITILSMSLVNLEWFIILGGVCTPFLTLSEFFLNFDFDQEEFDCLTPRIVNLMRVIIMLTFLAILTSLLGFFLDVIGSRRYMWFFVRKYALTSTCTVLWIMAIISSCYYVAVLLEDSLGTLYPKIDTSVNYGYGFYFVAAAGATSVIGTFCTLILMHTTQSEIYTNDDCLLDGFDDGFEGFNTPIPPPPYNIPPPPYQP